jgi:lipopolysaccharide/colanic/teichoic acid biosynthesis glycosyltransferase
VYRKIIKPAADILFAVFGIVLSSPLFLFLIPALWLANGGSVFFYSRRIGLGGKPFDMVKFQTLRHDDSGRLPARERLTMIGRFLRWTSIDELPQLWNVLTRNMSIVGPRPLPIEYLPLYSVNQHRRHDVLPGITGWAQVNGRHRIPWETKFDLDVYYVDHISFWLDMKIIFATVIVILSFKKDISLEEQAFKGN